MNRPAQSIVPFDFKGQMVRVMDRNGRPWWIGTDVAKALRYRNAPDMVRMLDEDEKDVVLVGGEDGAATHQVRSRGGSATQESGVNQAREMIIISESGVFHAILKSKKPEARAFRRWVTEELLPALRRDGTYAITPAPKSTVAQIEHSDRTSRRRELPGLLDRLEREQNPEKRRILSELIARACEADGIAPPDPDAIRPIDRKPEQAAELFTKIEALIAEGTLTNHHRREDRIAVNLPELRRLGVAVERGQMDCLRHHPRFMATCQVNCSDGRIRHCWVFLAEAP